MVLAPRGARGRAVGGRSSLRSKGLLRRTRKSCRLRWLKKLLPHLKSCFKFSAEEQRLVLDLQAKFGNKWARIATYFPGRTYSDVKNFWRSRQKRLARLMDSHRPGRAFSLTSECTRDPPESFHSRAAPPPVATFMQRQTPTGWTLTMT